MKKIHMIGNAHLDPVWLWNWQEGFSEVKATFRSALDRMNEYEDYYFTCSSSVFYEWIENNNKEMFEEIKKRVEEGRWNIVGGWYLQPDCNIPSGESFARQALYGQKYFREKFGRIAKVGYNVDSFGHNAMLPQLLKKSGLDYYVFMRPMPLEKGLPSRVFNWESDDGSTVLCYRIPYEYCTWGEELEKQIDRTISEFSGSMDELMCFYGVGNHGGGPTKRNIESIYERKNKEDSIEIIMSTPDKYFESLENTQNDYPTIHDDLQHHASGCYSVHSGVKSMNRRAENALIKAEKLSSIADIMGLQKYPDEFEKAWKDVLFNQFHDILAGTSIESAYEDAKELYYESLAIANRAYNYAAQAISWEIDIEKDEDIKPLVVFNPHSWDNEVIVETECAKIKENDYLTDEKGKLVASQIVKSEASANGRDKLCFKAKLPAWGYRVYKLVSNKKADKTFENINAKDNILENERFKLQFNKDSGYIDSIYDKKEETEVFEGQGARLVVIEDKSDTWSHNVFKFDNVEGEFKLKDMKIIESGPVKATMQIVYIYNKSEIVQEFSLYNGYDVIEVDVKINWQEELKMLKIKFPVNLNFRKATEQIPYGYIERDSMGIEEPGQGWVDFSGESKDSKKLYGFGLVNDSKYSFDFNVDEIGMSVLRSAVYAHHNPYKLKENERYSYIDKGIQKFKYSMIPHSGTVESSDIVKRQIMLNQKPFVIKETYHKGTLSQYMKVIDIDKDNIIASVLKKAEDGKGYILRCYETKKQNCKVNINLKVLNRNIKAEFKASEIKTFKIPVDSNEEITETNLIEWEER